MEMEIERRVGAGVEVREAGDGQTVMVGYAALYNVLSDDLGGFRELIATGAFADRLEDDVRALWQHDPLYVLGRTRSGTLRLSEDETGLRFEVSVPDAQWARDAVSSIRRGDVSQCSFAFSVESDQWMVDAEAGVVRLISRFERLFDVSPVTFAAYPATSVSVQQRAQALRARGGEAAESDRAAEIVRARDGLRLRVDVRRGMLRRTSA